MFGNSVPAESVTLSGDDGRETHVKQDQMLIVPYGVYTAKVRVQGFRQAVNVFTVDQPEQTIPIAMKLGVMEVPPSLCSIAGRVTSENTIGRVRALEAYGAYSRDVPVTNGLFRFENLECGDYVILAISRSGCVVAKVSRATVSGASVDLPFPASSGCNAPSKAER